MSSSNPFKVGDIVKTVNGDKVNGTIKYVACYAATGSGGKACNKKTCNHYVKNFVWVEWADKKLCSYDHVELVFDGKIEPETINNIGLTEQEKSKFKETAKVLEEETKKSTQFNWLEYNGIVQTRYTRDGRPYLVDVAGGGSNPDIQPIDSSELDYNEYNRTGFPVRKKS